MYVIESCLHKKMVACMCVNAGTVEGCAHSLPERSRNETRVEVCVKKNVVIQPMVKQAPKAVETIDLQIDKNEKKIISRVTSQMHLSTISKKNEMQKLNPRKAAKIKYL